MTRRTRARRAPAGCLNNDDEYKSVSPNAACHLLSAGIPLAFVSAQLGHAQATTTTRHYARWVGGSEYRRPPELTEGMVPADLLAAGAATRDAATG